MVLQAHFPGGLWWSDSHVVFQARFPGGLILMWFCRHVFLVVCGGRHTEEPGGAVRGLAAAVRQRRLHHQLGLHCHDAGLVLFLYVPSLSSSIS